MIRHLVPCTCGNVAARGNISTSTAIGLGILRHLRWDEAILAQRDASALSDTPSPASQLDSIRERLSAVSAVSMRTKLAQKLRNAAADSLHPLALLKGGGTDTGSDTGTTLKQFLSSYMGAHGKCDIYVTGHSKGGALCSTLALWLADTQGAQSNDGEK
jgi:hypothetical protein